MPNTQTTTAPARRAPQDTMRAVDANPASRQMKASAAPHCDSCSPADRYEELFVAVQRAAVFDDSKTFVDCAPACDPQEILAAYRNECGRAGFDLRAFVLRNFTPPHLAVTHCRVHQDLPIAEHIDSLWEELTRHPLQHPPQGSLLALPHPYVVPGGRFVEMYYWDTYFTMLGLVGCAHQELLHAMTDNLAYLIDQYGHVPNGNRTYYLSRSQPPVFALMAELTETCGGAHASQYLPQLMREHAFWMDGATTLAPGQSHRRVVALADGAVLNRYWDDRDTPREESWREDVATAALTDRPPHEVYRDLRAAAESGWDFSSRWLDASDTAGPATAGLSSTRTTRIVPVDLNALLHKLESTIARLSAEVGDAAVADRFRQYGARRVAAMHRHLWSDEEQAFVDHDWERGEPRRGLNAATATPLFTGSATQAQADALAATIRARLLAPGGLATTVVASGEQWDRPNGWAPLQWMAVCGLRDYGHHDLADEIRTRWLKTVDDVYAREAKLVEKYALRPTPGADSTGGAGGEYPLQDGFGWTNGVVRRWLAEPGASAPG